MKAGRTLALVGMLAFSASWATTFEKQYQLQDMASHASVAVLARVEQSRTMTTATGVYTMTSVQVREALWGTNSTSLVVATPGGSQQVGKLRLGSSIAGVPPLFAGQLVVLFLNQEPTLGAYSIVGFSQGVLNVVSTPQGTMVDMPGVRELVPWPQASRTMRDLRAPSITPAADSVLR